MWKIVDIPIVLIPMPEEGNNRVDEEDEEQAEDEDFFSTDKEHRSADTDMWVLLISCQTCYICAHRWRRHFALFSVFEKIV